MVGAAHWNSKGRRGVAPAFLFFIKFVITKPENMNQIQEIKEIIHNATQIGIGVLDSKAVEEINKNLSDIEKEITRLKEMSEGVTLIDAMKWKICRNLQANLTEEELSKLQNFARTAFKKPGFIYKEVHD